MTKLFQLLVEGLGQASTYALVAVGFVIIYKSMRVVSFAQPGLMVVGASFVVFLATEVGLSFYLAVPLAMVLTAGVGLLVERTTLRPMVGKPVFVVAIITLGVDVVLRQIVNRYVGLNLRPIGDPWGLDGFSLGGAQVQVRHLVMMTVTSAVVTGLFVFFKRSRTGLAMRAAAADQETALAQGVSVGRVFAISWAMAGALAALAGVFVGTGGGVDQQTWTVALKALPVIIVGGLDSIGGAVIGAVIVGLVESLVGGYQADLFPFLGQNFNLVSPYVIMVVILLVRPYGLFGTARVERV